MGRASQAWELYDIIRDLEEELDGRDMLRRHSTDPSMYDTDGNLVWIRRDTLLWEVLQTYFVSEFDMGETMETLCGQYGIENIYGEEE